MAKSVKSTQKSLKSSGFSSHFSALFCAFFALFHCWRLSCSLDSLHAMKPFLRKKLETIQERLHDLEGLLSAPDIMADLQAFRGLSQEHAQVTPTAGRYARYQQIEKNIQEAKEMLQETELAELARDEIAQGEAELEKLEQELQRLLLPQDPDDERAAFIEIRAGTGGDESALFAADLARMYIRYAGNQGWHVETVSESPSEVGGYKEIVLRFARGHSHGNEASVGVYGQMRFESGGHRVQRVPVTETQGRIHTSACTVAVMPEPDPAQATLLNPADLRIDTFRASGAGGQHINKTDSAVRVVHLPTGLVAECQDGRSQHSNKAKALQVLQARLQDKERSERAAQEAATRKGLIGSGDRSDRIRTYNFPQGRMTDHRINLTLYKLLFIMEGDLAETIEALLHAREQEQLQALELGQ
jgi:peptide chain release factor 1